MNFQLPPQLEEWEKGNVIEHGTSEVANNETKQAQLGVEVESASK